VNKYPLIAVVFFLSLMTGFVNADGSDKAAAETAKKEPPKEEESVTEHTVTINGVSIPYKAVTGTVQLKDDQGAVKANLFYVAYTRSDVEKINDRPISFVFNGGPGSASVWLHMGILGPKRVLLTDDGYSQPPYSYITNEFSILDVSDLVFIDPVSTGYSRPSPGEDAKQFHGVDEDVKWVAEFIRLYTTRNGRWESPKFLIGESYGTTRAAALAEHLHEELNMYLNGIVLISSILDFQTYDKIGSGNDLPFILYLPSYTAAAWYHKKLPEDLQTNLEKAMKEAEEFSYNEYALALLKGDLLSQEKRKEIAQKLSRLTGLTPEYILKTNLRVNIQRFVKELLRKDNRTIGRFDSRYLGIDSDKNSDSFEYDPSADAIFGAFTAAFNQYVRADLKWQKDENYRVLVDVQPWNYGKATNSYLNVASNLRSVMTRNPYLQVFVANGYYDLATPYFGTDYTFSHLFLDPTVADHVKMEYYDGGHMMYTQKPILIKMSADLRNFINNTLKK